MFRGSSSFHSCRDLYQCASSDVMMCSSGSVWFVLVILFMVVTPCRIFTLYIKLIDYLFRSPTRAVVGNLNTS